MSSSATTRMFLPMLTAVEVFRVLLASLPVLPLPTPVLLPVPLLLVDASELALLLPAPEVPLIALSLSPGAVVPRVPVLALLPLPNRLPKVLAMRLASPFCTG